MYKSGKRGSAYLFVIGVISVLAVIVIFFFKNTTSRRFSTRMMTDEKKAEAVAEAAVDLTMGFIKEKMNKPEDLNFYPFFRYPCKLTKSSLGNSSGKNIPLQLAAYQEPIEMLGNTPALQPLKYIIEELGGEDNVKVEVKCQVVFAEAFASRKDGYQVVGISKKSVPAVGVSAKFLDSISSGPSDDGPLSEYHSNWLIDFKLPNQTYEDTHKIYVSGIGALLKPKVKVTRLGPYETELKVKGEISPIGKKVGPIDVMEDYIRDFLNIDPKYPLLNMESVRDMAMEGDHNKNSLNWKASNLAGEINSAYGAVPAAIKSKIDSDPYGGNPQVVEKAGILQIRAKVEYFPNGQSGKAIEKTLVANRPFKVSDVQPPAPEYSLFIANSNLLFEGGGDNPAGLNLGEAIDFLPPAPPAMAVASICVHNLPGGEYDKITGLTGTSAGPKSQVPGMVRINSRGEMAVNSYLGTKDEPYLTEFNALVNAKALPNHTVLPTFRWNDSPTGQRFHELEFPVISDLNSFDQEWKPNGFANLMNILSLCTALEGPIQFYGLCFMEYPLGFRLEAKMKQRFARMILTVKPSGTSSGKDTSKIHIKYSNERKKYGIDGMEGYSSGGEWSPDDYACMPANVYSLLQYAKKATYFYKTEDEFWADSKRFTSDGTYISDGVTYIMDSLTVPNSGEKFKVKGNGILVAKTNITVNGEVERVDDAIFTLMARIGYIHFTSECSEVQASCFSNCSPIFETTSQLAIKGNLVVNEFVRADVDFLDVFYDSAAVRITPLSVMRDVGKFEPKRYHVSVAENWSSYKFAKKD